MTYIVNHDLASTQLKARYTRQVLRRKYATNTNPKDTASKALFKYTTTLESGTICIQPHLCINQRMIVYTAALVCATSLCQCIRRAYANVYNQCLQPHSNRGLFGGCAMSATDHGWSHTGYRLSSKVHKEKLTIQSRVNYCSEFSGTHFDWPCGQFPT